MLRAALVTPLSGPLGLFGRAGAGALRLWADWTTERGTPIELIEHDAHPAPSAAWRAAAARRPDILFGPYGSGPAREIDLVATTLWWNHGGAAVDAGPAPHIDVLGTAGGYFDGAIELTAGGLPRPATITIAHGASGFGRTIADDAARTAGDRGLTVQTVEIEDPAGLPVLPPGDVVLVAADFATERAVAEVLLDRVPGVGGWALRSPWRLAVMVAAGTAEVLADFGSRREGLLGPAQWLAVAAPDAPELGPTAGWLVAAHTARFGVEPSYPAAQAFAAGVLAVECIDRAGGTDPEDVLAAALSLDTTTLFGRFRLDPDTHRQVGHQMVTVQWQDGRRVPVWPPGANTQPLRLRPDGEAQPVR